MGGRQPGVQREEARLGSEAQYRDKCSAEKQSFMALRKCRVEHPAGSKIGCCAEAYQKGKTEQPGKRAGQGIEQEFIAGFHCFPVLAVQNQRKRQKRHPFKAQIQRDVVSSESDAQYGAFRHEKKRIIAAVVFLMLHVFLREQAAQQPHECGQACKKPRDGIRAEV